ncbi:MAG TPA: outer membrane lipid asymmetry maintenance protein MlaD [Nitrospirae bacterium]|nr:putative phospholipid ABC transporter-binding protein MlaD [bacterium BMS3Abin10]GBE39881.1 putative phospholipid ABC transporter-binding protein MlaD [bacterium BMS3Bbin08]HDH50869.1 outer membrane lipid asymmetry maintenance protein MlaD [Nitrospirota bacterium]HDK16989.1 outer membrane lipid asymmetry maintenance protein MlaD [Nitrospirota bacterium]HDK82441.1 outer membrane lipid asymmetry maintenance protein MlaD [Nitrospirota bacterium]
MKKINIETGVGIFLIIGFICLGYLSVSLGNVSLFGTDQYAVNARFANISGLKEGAPVEIAGVTVGKVSKIDLEDYEASVELLIAPDVKLQEDSIASIRTQGIIGDKYIKISPGGAEEFIEPGGEIFETESTIDLEELVGKYIFDKE